MEPKKDVNYCLFAGKEWVIQSYGLDPELPRPIQHYSLPPLMHSGLTNWAKVFEGIIDVPQTMAEIAALDIIHINLPMNNVGRLLKLRKHVDKLPKKERPAIIANVDYAVEMWEGFREFDYFLQAIEAADVVFNVHPVMTKALRGLTRQDALYTFPHPTDIDALLRFKEENNNERISETRVITMVAHSYDQNYLIPLYTLTEFLHNHGLENDYQVVIVGAVEKDKMRLNCMADHHFTMLPFPELMRLILSSDVVIDTATTHSYGRVPVECAVMGIPCIGARRIDSMKLHDEAGRIDIFDGDAIYNALELFVGAEKEKSPLYGVKQYGYEQAKINMLSALKNHGFDFNVDANTNTEAAA